METLFPLIAGNEKLKNQLRTAICTEPPALAHAYIIEGPSGSGKRTLAKSIAASLVCENRGKTGSLPCGTCLNCRKIFKGISPDVISIKREDGKQGLGVDQVRNLRTDVHIYPNELEYKFYIVENADTMTAQAQNAFLLTLEEPPAYGVILLLCENSRALLETVRSRAQTLRMQPLSNSENEKRVLEISPGAALKKEKDRAVFDSAIISSRGCPGKAIELLTSEEGLAIAERHQEIEKFIRLAADRRHVADAMTELVSYCSGNREKATAVISDLSDALRDLILLKKSENCELRFYSDPEKATETADMFPMKKLLAFSDAAAKAASDAERYINVRLGLMTMLCDAGII